VVVLQHHGLLLNKRATVHPALAEKLINKESVTERIVVDGNCITSRGPGTVLEFSIKLIELLFDREKADRIAGPMLIRS
ncbi:MAG: DJ-1/PfpI family protein, partial [Candidatus Cloacimonetes bacterium]|nr:DJ-1/PfpI family protein [Candidatus Cloacimonadota bacterium]